MTLADRVLRRFADLQPPLGDPGGPCQVVQRIHEEVRNPRLQDHLVQEVEEGEDLSNPEAAQVYQLDREPGWRFVRNLLIGPHAQYRMDLRSITIKDVQVALAEFAKMVNTLKSKKHPLAESYTRQMASGTPIKYADPKTDLVVVFALEARDTAKLITTYWLNKPTPKGVPSQGCPTHLKVATATIDTLPKLVRYLNLEPWEKALEVVKRADNEGDNSKFFDWLREEFEGRPATDPMVQLVLSDPAKQYEVFYEDFAKETLAAYYDSGDWVPPSWYQPDSDAPSWFNLSRPKRVRGEWLISATNHAKKIAREGFQYGTSDLSTLGSKSSKAFRGATPGKYNFAFLASDQTAYQKLRKYGFEAVVFRADGVSAWHDGDQERQVIFQSSTARDITPLTEEFGVWSADDQGSFGSLQEAAAWATKAASMRVARRFQSAVLSKQWLMGVRRGWLTLMKPHIGSWDDVERAFEKIKQFATNLEDQVLWVRRGPYTSTLMEEGQKLQKQFKTLHGVISQAASSARHWRDVAENMGRLPGGGAGFRQEDGLKMFDLYQKDFAEATSTSVEMRGNRWKQAKLTDLMDDILESLRKDAKKIVEYYEKGNTERLEVEDEVYKQFDFHGMKIVIDDSSMRAGMAREYIKYLEKAYQALKSKGLAKVWYGEVFIQCDKCGGENPHGAEFGVGGDYRIGPNTIRVYERPNDHVVHLIVHELGHRYWYKDMSQAQRGKFESLVQVKAEPRINPLLTRDVEGDVAAARKDFGEFMEFLPTALKRIKADFDAAEKMEFAQGSKLTRDDAIANELQSAAMVSDVRYREPPNLYEVSVPMFKESVPQENYVKAMAARDALIEHLEAFEKLPGVGEYKPEYAMEHLTGIRAWLAEAWKLQAKYLLPASHYLSDVENALKAQPVPGDTRPVIPVSGYGWSNISEAWAEMFAYYVLDHDKLNRDQVDSFKAVLKLAKDNFPGYVTTVAQMFRQAGDAHARSVALMKFLSRATKQLGVSQHTYVVGGAVRNFLIDQPIKDTDIVIDSVRAGKDSEWLAKRLQGLIPVATNLTTNQYGVAILTIKGEWLVDGHSMAGEVIEIANARKESYGGESGKGYKPHMVEPATIEEDLSRREFSFNTLLWRLHDLEHGPEQAEVLDLLGVGRQHLEQRELRTPVDPDKTFSDDPTRMMRAIKFVSKYHFKIPPDMVAAIQRNASKLKQMPWDAVRKILVEDILEGPAPRRSVKLMHDLGLGHVLGEMLHEEPGFASALGRSLNDMEIHLVLDLLDLGWTMKTPVGFLNRDQQARLREVLLANAEDQAFEHAFVQALQKPPVDQQWFFTEFAIPPRERAVVAQEARRLLLDKPELALAPPALKDALEAVLGAKYPRASMAEKVASRFSV